MRNTNLLTNLESEQPKVSIDPNHQIHVQDLGYKLIEVISHTKNSIIYKAFSKKQTSLNETSINNAVDNIFTSEEEEDFLAVKFFSLVRIPSGRDNLGGTNSVKDSSEDSQDLKLIKREIGTLIQIKNKNVIDIKDVLLDKERVAIVFDYAKNGSLRDFLDLNEKRISLNFAIGLILQVLNGVEGIHAADIVHRDLKPENILVFEEGLIRITDFGLALNRKEFQSEQNDFRNAVGTFDYLAPEVIRDGVYDYGADIYSVGVIFYELVMGELPFVGNSIFDKVTRKLNAHYKKITSDNAPLNKETNKESLEFLNSIFEKVFNPLPKGRYKYAKEMKADLESLRKLIHGQELLQFAATSSAEGDETSTKKNNENVPEIVNETNQTNSLINLNTTLKTDLKPDKEPDLQTPLNSMLEKKLATNLLDPNFSLATPGVSPELKLINAISPLHSQLPRQLGAIKNAEMFNNLGHKSLGLRDALAKKYEEDKFLQGAVSTAVYFLLGMLFFVFLAVVYYS